MPLPLTGLVPTLLDRLLPEPDGADPFAGLMRDLEDLLNTVLDREIPAAFPELRRSVLGYGLPALGSLEALTPAQQSQACRIVSDTIARHEPRLRRVRTTWTGATPRDGSGGMSIAAVLSTGGGQLVLAADLTSGRFRLRAAG